MLDSPITTIGLVIMLMCIIPMLFTRVRQVKTDHDEVVTANEMDARAAQELAELYRKAEYTKATKAEVTTFKMRAVTKPWAEQYKAAPFGKSGKYALEVFYADANRPPSHIRVNYSNYSELYILEGL